MMPFLFRKEGTNVNAATKQGKCLKNCNNKLNVKDSHTYNPFHQHRTYDLLSEGNRTGDLCSFCKNKYFQTVLFISGSTFHIHASSLILKDDTDFHNFRLSGFLKFPTKNRY